MSWDVLILNSDTPVDFEKGNWPDFLSKEQVRNSIKKTFPESSWENSSWGNFTNELADIEFNLGKDDSIGNSFMLHVRGGEKVVQLIYEMCKSSRWTAYDMSAENYIDEKQSSEGMEKWESYKEIVLPKKEKKKPWWKF